MAKTRTDLDLNFEAHPNTADVSKLTGENAVKRSLRNLFNLNRFDKPFHPEITADIRSLLFENSNPFLETDLKEKLVKLANRYEPRANITKVSVNLTPDENIVSIKVLFNVPPSVMIETVTFNLERIR